MRTSSRAEVEDLTSRLQALAEPTRLQIIDLLRSGERCVCDLTDTFGGGQSRLSFHLRVLKEARLVTDRRDGRWVYYTLDTEALASVAVWLTQPVPAWRRARNRCT